MADWREQGVNKTDETVLALLTARAEVPGAYRLSTAKNSSAELRD